MALLSLTISQFLPALPDSKQYEYVCLSTCINVCLSPITGHHSLRADPAFVGGIVAGVIGFSLMVSGLVYYGRRRKRNSSKAPDTLLPGSETPDIPWQSAVNNQTQAGPSIVTGPPVWDRSILTPVGTTSTITFASPVSTVIPNFPRSPPSAYTPRREGVIGHMRHESSVSSTSLSSQVPLLSRMNSVTLNSNVSPVRAYDLLASF